MDEGEIGRQQCCLKGGEKGAKRPLVFNPYTSIGPINES